MILLRKFSIHKRIRSLIYLTIPCVLQFLRTSNHHLTKTKQSFNFPHGISKTSRSSVITTPKVGIPWRVPKVGRRTSPSKERVLFIHVEAGDVTRIAQRTCESRVVPETPPSNRSQQNPPPARKTTPRNSPGTRFLSLVRALFASPRKIRTGNGRIDMRNLTWCCFIFFFVVVFCVLVDVSSWRFVFVDVSRFWFVFMKMLEYFVFS